LALAIDNARQLEQVQRLSERLGQQNVYLREEIQSEHDYGEMIGQSAAMVRVRESIARVAPTDSTVLVCGETGVGKELVARAIHAASPRAEQPMVKVNCAAIPEGMVESELFGHERGAFTSAVERRVGRFELARDGTLFLDEIAELSLPVQAKLLRVLQDGQFERVGGTRTLTSNARIITATNRNLLNCVESGSFRSDLYYRLNVFPIEVPPLRDRREDIPLLIEAFVKQFSRRMGKRVEAIAPHTLTCLCQRNWPGNIRELRHEIERAMILQDDPVLRVDCRAPAQVEVAHLPTGSQQPAFQTLEEAEAEHIRNALAETAGVIEGPRGAAQLLDMKPSTLRFRMKRLGIARSS
jgi:formate hydrogenlyase transcriptional activator